MITEAEYKGRTSKITLGDVCRYFIFSVFSIALIYISFRMVFPVVNIKQLPLKNIAALGAVLLFCLLLWVIRRYILTALSDKTKEVCSILMFILFIMLEIFCAQTFEVKPTWDFGEVINGAKQISLGQSIVNSKYFELYPHNLNPAIIIGTYLKIFNDVDKSLYILNIMAISLSVAGAYLITKKVLGINAAVIVMLFCLLSTPLYLYVPIVYTDTLALPFPVLSLYFWIKWRAANCPWKQVLYFSLIGAFSAIGFLIKPIAAIVFVAAIVELFISVVFKSLPSSGLQKLLFSLPSAILAFLLILAIFNSYVGLMGYQKNISSERALPYTHWLMMGMNRPIKEGGTSYGYGGFSGEDLTFSRSFETKSERIEANLSRMEERLKDFGPKGYTSFLLKKLEWTWTDGTYFAPVKLAREPLKRGVFHQYVLYDDGKNTNTPYLMLCQIVHSATLFLMLFGTIGAILSRNMGGLKTVIVLSCLGIMIFLLAWETRSRYLTFFIPVFNIMAVSGLEEVIQKFDGLVAPWRGKNTEEE